FQDLREPPTLRLRQRPRLDDADAVADVRLVLLVVCVELERTADHLLVELMRSDGLDLDDDRLVHCVGDDDAATLLSAATLVLRLLEPHDRLASRRLLALRPRALPACASRDVLEAALARGLGGSRRRGRCGRFGLG